MNQLVRRFYIVVFVVAVTVAAGLFMEFKYFENAIENEMEDKMMFKIGHMASEINAGIVRRRQAVKAAVSFVEIERDEDKILRFLKETMKRNTSFSSIYFGTPQNQMLNGSGLVPDSDFDLRTRLWYTKAVQEKRMVYTQPYNDALNGKLVMTMAQPVYGENGDVMGVVGGDTLVQSLLEGIEKQKLSANSYSFLLNGNGNILVHSRLKEASDSDAANTVSIPEGLKKEMLQRKSGMVSIELEGENGHAGWHNVEGTDWIVGSFVPSKDYLRMQRQISAIFILILFSAGIVFSILLVLQRRHIVKPITTLDSDIRKISVADDLSYRLPEDEKDPFFEVRKSTNLILKKTHEYFEKMKENHDELESANDELSATLNQITAIESELRSQHEELIDSKRELAKSEKRNRAIVNALPDMVFRLDSKGVFLDCQVADESRLLLKKDDFLGKKVEDIMPEEISSKGMESIGKALETGRLQQFEYSLEFGGSTAHYEMRAVKSGEDEVIAIVREITEQKNNQDRIAHLSYHDQLTDLYNRRFFEEAIERLDSNDNLPLTLAMVDVNGLKLVNDAFGHAAGDELLKKVSDILKTHCPKCNSVSRIGGDEFVMLLPNTSSEETESIVKRIYKAAGTESIESIPISISIGWETKTSEEDPVSKVFGRAEDHMYRKKLAESQSMRNQTVRVIVKTLNEKNEREKVHSEQVGRICRLIAENMELGNDVINEIETAGLLHDIGKIAISDDILNKPGRLTDLEYEEIKKHSESGYQILKSVDEYSGLAEHVLSHHERWDGGGYPRGLKGKEIPFIARIISVADAYEAMVSDRPYRTGMGKEAAISEIKRNCGVQFDPEIVNVFVDKVVDRL